jgi:hypothetical protein
MRMGTEENQCFRSWNAFSTYMPSQALDERCQWRRHSTEVSHKSLIEMNKTPKTLNLLDRAGSRPIDHRSYLLGVHQYTGLRHDVPQEGDLRNVKLTLFGLHEQVMSEESLKDLADMLDMFNHEDEDVIQVHKHEQVKEDEQHIIDQDLENGWSISKSKRHDPILIISIRSVERCLPFISLSDVHQILHVP